MDAQNGEFRATKRIVESGKAGSKCSKSKISETNKAVPKNLKHKDQLSKLAKTDPEFFKFLKEQEADLLEFDDFDDAANEGEIAEESFIDEEAEDKVNAKERTSVKSNVISNEDFSEFENSFLNKAPSAKRIREMIEMFKACVARVGANSVTSKYTVIDEHCFHRIICFCFQNLGQSIYAVLQPNAEKINKPSKKSLKCKDSYKRWKKHSSMVKAYLNLLLMFLNEIQTDDAIVHTLRAIMELSDLYVRFNKLSRTLIKSLMQIWSRKSDVCRCSAFVNLCKLIRTRKTLFPTILKSCYFGYINNVREVTPETWPLITFMQKSFSEICFLNIEVSYQYAFVYIRQAAIHLRNAMIAKKKNLIQTIYNWQFIQCLYLWTRVISKSYQGKSDSGNAEGLKELSYPLCQITIASMKLFPSVKFLPLRIHCIRILLLLQMNSGMYIPTLPLSIQLLEDAALLIRKKPNKGKGVTKGIDVNCMLKASSSLLEEAGYRQAVMDSLFDVQLEAAYLLRASCSFPDIMVPLTLIMKTFIKKCDSLEYSKLFKSLNAKLDEHARRINSIISSSEVNLRNQYIMALLNFKLRDENLPLPKFYKSWKTIRKMKQDAIQQTSGMNRSSGESASSKIGKEQDTNNRKRRFEKEESSSQFKRMKNTQESSVKKHIKTDIFLNNGDLVQDLVLSDDEV